MTRTILVHLNVAVPDDDPRTPDEIADLVAVAVSNDLDLEASAPLAEEIEP